MKNISLFITNFIQQVTVGAVETEETAKKHCEEFYVGKWRSGFEAFFICDRSAQQNTVIFKEDTT